MIARIVLDGPPLHHFLSGKRVFAAVERVLLRTFASWPNEFAAKFLITHGGFLDVTAPAELFGSAGWSSAASDIRRAQHVAEKALHSILTPRVLKVAHG